MSSLQELFNKNENEQLNVIEEINVFKQPSQIISSVITLYKYQNSSETQLGHKGIAIIRNEFNKDIFNIICYETKNRKLEFSIPLNPLSSLTKYKFSFTIIEDNIMSFFDHMQSSLQWKLKFPNKKIFNQFIISLTMTKIPNISYKWQPNQKLIIQDLNIPCSEIEYKSDIDIKHKLVKIKTHLKIWTFSDKHPFEKGLLIFDNHKIINICSDKVIPALVKGLIGIKQNVTRFIIASPHLCFGNKGNKALNIPPDTPLMFEIAVIKINIQNNNNGNNEFKEIDKNENKEMNNMEIREKFYLYDAKLDSLSMGIERNNKLMMDMQTNMNNICEQLNDLRLIVTEEKKNDAKNNIINDELKNIKKEINVLKQLMNLNGNTDIYEVQLWMMNDVGLPEYTKLFVENGFDNMDVMKTVTFNDLELLGIDKLGHKKRIMQKIKIVKEREQCEGVSSND